MEKALPLGSIVKLKKGTDKIMILSRGVQLEMDKEINLFDYAGCLYPVGLVPSQAFYFNRENIDEVMFEGFVDEDEREFQSLYENWLETEGKDIPKGKVGNL